jgi:hypothetical protein
MDRNFREKLKEKREPKEKKVINKKRTPARAENTVSDYQ